MIGLRSMRARNFPDNNFADNIEIMLVKDFEFILQILADYSPIFDSVLKIWHLCIALACKILLLLACRFQSKNTETLGQSKSSTWWTWSVRFSDAFTHILDEIGFHWLIFFFDFLLPLSSSFASCRTYTGSPISHSPIRSFTNSNSFDVDVCYVWRKVVKSLRRSR